MMDEETKQVELPEDTDEVFAFAPEDAWLTLNRAPDGSVYLVSWWYGTPTVLAAVMKGDNDGLATD